MKKTVGEINFNNAYLKLKVCNCSYDDDEGYGEVRRWCPIKCPLRNNDILPAQCLLDLINERENLNSKIKKFENVEIEVDKEYLRKLEKLQNKGLFAR